MMTGVYSWASIRANKKRNKKQERGWNVAGAITLKMGGSEQILQRKASTSVREQGHQGK